MHLHLVVYRDVNWRQFWRGWRNRNNASMQDVIPFLPFKGAVHETAAEFRYREEGLLAECTARLGKNSIEQWDWHRCVLRQTALRCAQHEDNCK